MILERLSLPKSTITSMESGGGCDYAAYRAKLPNDELLCVLSSRELHAEDGGLLRHVLIEVRSAKTQAESRQPTNDEVKGVMDFLRLTPGTAKGTFAMKLEGKKVRLYEQQ
jgi:hypothetical protein